MGNQLLTANAASAAAGGESAALPPQTHGAMPQPSYNTLIEMLDSVASDEKNQSKWYWMDENGRETNSYLIQAFPVDFSLVLKSAHVCGGPLWVFIAADTAFELRKHAIRVANELILQGAKPGDCVMLVFPPSLEAMVAFWGCVYAGVISVPVMPPDPTQPARDLPRFNAMVSHCGAKIALTNRQYQRAKWYVRVRESLSWLRSAGNIEQWPQLQWVEVDSLDPNQGVGEEGWVHPACDRDTPAFIQYSSGSTGAPKATVITHYNLVWQAYVLCSHAPRPHRIVSWAPHWHDLGLNLNFMAAVLNHGNVVFLMSPLDFLKKPSLWLRIISKHRGTISVAPTFAFSLVCNKVTDQELKTLDLSCCTGFYLGAEPINALVIQKFVERFGVAGVKMEHLHGTYGLAENTLCAAIDPFKTGCSFLSVDANELELNGVAVVLGDGATGSSNARLFASSGVPVLGTDIRLVNPENATALPERHVGEVWISSPCVGSKYLHMPEVSAQTFAVKLSSVPKGLDPAVMSNKYLRTGDKGFVHNGHLYIVGRMKDLIIVNGRNIAPQDVEFFVQEHFPQLRPGCQVAVQVQASTENAATEAFVFITEIRETDVDTLRGDEQKAMELAVAIRTAIFRQFQTEAHSISFIEPRTIPKTTSGKVRRADAGKLWRADGLRKIYQAVFASSSSLSSLGSMRGRSPGRSSSPGLSPRLKRASAIVPAASKTEETILEIVQNVFGLSAADVGVTDDLWELGLDSIRLMQLKSRLETLYSSLNLEDVLNLESVTVRTLSEVIDSTSGSADTSSSRRGIRGPVALTEMDKRGAAGSILSFGQERLLLVHRKLGGSTCSYNVPVAVRIRSRRGPIDARQLVECITKVLNRHSVVSRTYPAGSDKKPAPVHPSVVIMAPTARNEEDAMKEIVDSLNSAARTPFNINNGPLAKVILYSLSATDLVLFVNIHHIATDGWSMGILMRDLSFAINGEPLKPLSLQFEDYAIFERANLAARDTWNQKISFWKNELSDLRDALVWLPRKSLGARERSEAGEVSTFTLSEELVAQLSALAQSARTTLFVVMMAAFQLVMYRYSQLDDIFVVSPFANRRYRNVEDVIGYFINTLIIRNSFKDAAELPFRQLIARVKETVSRVSAHQDFPVELACKPSTELFHPLFRTMFSFRNFPLTLDVPGYAVEQLYEVNTAAAMYEFALELQPNSNGNLIGMVQYSTDLFTRETILNWQNHFVAVLKAICENPSVEVSQVSMFSEEEATRLKNLSSVASTELELTQVCNELESENENGIVAPEFYTVHHLVSKAAAKYPNNIALVHQKTEVTFAELDQLTTTMAAELIRSKFVNMEENPTVAVVLPRGIGMIQAYLALMKAGAAYMPMLITHPDSWVEQLLRESGSMHLICAEDSLARFKTLATQIDPKISVVALESLIQSATSRSGKNDSFKPASDPNKLIYVIFTSGSTGAPKGVLVPHRGVASNMFYQGRRLGMSPNDRQLQFFSPQFDGAASEMWLPLMWGTTVVFPPEETIKVGRELITLMTDQRITFVMILPNVLRLLTLNPVQSLRAIQVCGEACPADVVSAFRDQNWSIKIFNAYGPTEASICTTIGELTANANAGDQSTTSTETLETAPIGRPLPLTTAYIVDKNLELLPPGFVGELLIGGNVLARGYHNLVKQTEERFLELPKLGRVFRTGDHARFLPDGQLQIIGRIDDQVKVNGYRIEIGQIEQALLSTNTETIAQVAVVAWKRQGSAVIAAFVVPRGKTPIDIPSLTAQAQAKLPAYMIPTKIVSINELPLTPNGKVDKKKLQREAESRNRHALPGSRTRRPSVSEIRAPEGNIEVALAAIWAKLLGIDFVARASNFFELGGSSITLMLQQQAILEKFGVALPIELFYQKPTLRELAAVVELAITEGDSAAQVLRVDLEQEAQLPADLQAALTTTSSVVDSGQRHIFLTGASGLFGSHLLYELLNNASSEARFYCLVRAENSAAGMKRIIGCMKKYGLWNPDFERRITPVIGTLGVSQMGLSLEKWNELARGIDTIYHSGAMVSFVAPYAELKDPNVNGTLDILRLATTLRLKPVHYVSTLSVFPTNTTGEMLESAIGDWRQLREGYAQSKWVAEQVVRSAMAAGLPGAIYRLGRMPFNSRTGSVPEVDTMVKWVQAAIQTATTPELDFMLDILPVDYAAHMMAKLSLDAVSIGGTWHIVHPNPISYASGIKIIQQRGYWISSAKLEDWKKLIRAIAKMRQEEPNSQMSNDIATAIMGTLEQMSESDFAPGVFSCKETLRILPRGPNFPDLPPAEKLFTRLVELMEQHSMIWQGVGMDVMEGYSTKVWPVERELPWVKNEYARRCIKCISSENRVPLDLSGICQECRNYAASGPEDPDRQAKLLEEFNAFMKSQVGKGDQYDALLLFSGGKDSTYLFHRLRTDFPELRVLAVTISHEFLSDVAVQNAQNVVQKLDAEHIIVRPVRSLFRKNYGYSLANPVVGSISVACDNMDGNLTHDIGRTMAASMNIPLVLSGVSKTQVDTLFKTNSFLVPDEALNREMLVPVEGLQLENVFEKAEFKYFMASRKDRSAPKLVFPHYAWAVPEDVLKKEVTDLGLLSQTKETPLATNNRVLPLMMASDIAKNGYCGFEREFALQIRQDKAHRSYWLPLFEILDYFCRTRRFANMEIDEMVQRLGLTRELVGLGSHAKSVTTVPCPQ